MSMQTPASAAGPGAQELAAPKQGSLPRQTVGGLIAISIFWFAINFHWAALQLLIVPGQVTQLLLRVAPGATLSAQASWVTANRPLILAMVSAPGLIVALIANPLFGLFSDRTHSRFGRRRPYVVCGTAVNVVALVLMALLPASLIQTGQTSSLVPALIALTGGLMLAQLANNSAVAPFHALLPDLVPEEQRGTASGIMGLALFLGQIGGAVAPSLFGFNSDALLSGKQSFAAYQHGIMLSYVSVIVVIVVMASLTAILVHERPWTPDATSDQTAEPLTQTMRDLVLTVVVIVVVSAALIGLLASNITRLSLSSDTLNVVELVAVVLAGLGAAKAFDFRPRRNPDFSWVVLTRMLVMMGVYMVQSFLVYFMGDVAHAPSPEMATTEFVIVLTVTALISTSIAGWASDRFGRKRMVYVSGTFMAIVGAVFVLAPLLVPQLVLPIAFAVSAIFGLGYGAYISVDWALVADVLPSGATFARDMGIWNLGLTVPQVFALVLGSWLIALGTVLVSKTFGYTLLFIWFVVFCVAGTVTVRFIKGVKR